MLRVRLMHQCFTLSDVKPSTGPNLCGEAFEKRNATGRSMVLTGQILEGAD